jgi:hypothetical protein
MRQVATCRWLAAAALAAAALGLQIDRAGAFPQPTLVPTSWQLDIKYNAPAAIAVRLPGETVPTLYWYFTYTVTNNTGAEQNFVPEIALLTDAGDLLSANRNIPPRVFSTVKKELRNPLLRSPTEVVGRVLQGPDYAVDGIAIWPMPLHDVDRVSIFFRGLSGEAYEVPDPKTDEVHLLRRTLMIEYQTPGSVERQPRKPWLFKDEKWVVR